MRGPVCSECVAHVMEVDRNGALRGAAASVGIEHGMSTDQMLSEFAQAYHARGHKTDVR